ncbi:MAG: hypothetical protein U1E23_19085 [Reyranellaceae bacterium]
MRAPFLISALALAAAIASPAAAQLVPGSVGNAGRMPETMLPGALPPPPTLPAPTISPPVTTAPSTSWGSRYPDTESLSRERIQSQGYRVQRMTPELNGSWKADATRDATPGRPRVPKQVTIYPDGRMVEEY